MFRSPGVFDDAHDRYRNSYTRLWQFDRFDGQFIGRSGHNRYATDFLHAIVFENRLHLARQV